jgi:hypothetical protein
LKRCTHCKVEKAFDAFYTHPKMADGRLGQCKPCRDSYVAAWVQKNKVRRREIGRASASLNRTPERSAAAFAKWYETAYADPAKRARMKSRVAKRRAVQIAATPSWANEFFIEQAYELAQLRTERLGVKWEVDHIVPLQSDLVCGLHVEHNLRVIPATANRSKKNHWWPQGPMEKSA